MKNFLLQLNLLLEILNQFLNIVNMKSITQQHKVTSMRTLVSRALNGLPINATTCQVFDLDTPLDSPDLDGQIIDDSSDPLEVQEHYFDIMQQQVQERSEQIRDEKRDKIKKHKEREKLKEQYIDELIKKGGIKIHEETPPQTTPPQPSE